MTEATITLTETETPSRSKGTGCVWIGTGAPTFASAKGRELATETGAEHDLHIKVTLRRASGRSTIERAAKRIVATGNPDDTVTIRLGSPQAYEATITGAQEA